MSSRFPHDAVETIAHRVLCLMSHAVSADPLEQTVGHTHVDTEIIYKANPEVFLQQLIHAVDEASRKSMSPASIAEQPGRQLLILHSTSRMSELDAAEAAFFDGDRDVSYSSLCKCRPRPKGRTSYGLMTALAMRD